MAVKQLAKPADFEVKAGMQYCRISRVELKNAAFQVPASSPQEQAPGGIGGRLKQLFGGSKPDQPAETVTLQPGGGLQLGDITANRTYFEAAQWAALRDQQELLDLHPAATLAEWQRALKQDGYKPVAEFKTPFATTTFYARPAPSA